MARTQCGKAVAMTVLPHDDLTITSQQLHS